MWGETVERYRQFLGEYAWLAQAFCWTVVEPVTGPVDVARVVRRLGGDPAEVQPRELEAGYDFDDTNCVFFLHQEERAVSLLEVNGYQGSRREVLRQLSDGARVHSTFWNVNASNQFSYAAYGQIVTELDVTTPEHRYGLEPDALDDDLGEFLREPPEEDQDAHPWRAASLAAVETRTGVALDAGWLDGEPASIVVASLPDDPSAPSNAIEIDLDVRLRMATDTNRHTAIVRLLDHLATAYHLDTEPAFIRGLDALRAGRALDEANLWEVSAAIDRLRRQFEQHRRDTALDQDPHWRTFQAGYALSAAVRARSWPAQLDALRHARNALAEDWPTARAQLRADLRHS